MENKWWPYILAGESIFFLFFWLVNPYLAWLLTIVLCPIFIGIYIIARLAEWIEKSKVDRSYFFSMFWLGIIPLIWTLLFVWLDDFSLSWMKD
ncbi:MAG: hypothetical protein WAT79_12130 [Saprospiraceae bacterium]